MRQSFLQITSDGQIVSSLPKARNEQTQVNVFSAQSFDKVNGLAFVKEYFNILASIDAVLKLFKSRGKCPRRPSLPTVA